MKKKFTLILLISNLLFASCNKRKPSVIEEKDEEISVNTTSSTDLTDTSVVSSIEGNSDFKLISTNPSIVVLTGLANHRLVSIYKRKIDTTAIRIKSNYSSVTDNDISSSEIEEHFMPGFDILYGYNLINIAHFNLQNETKNFLFNKPVLVKTLYFPSFIQDSIKGQAITRNFYLVSVYNEDTNKDTLINRKDLRRFYYLNENCNIKIQLIPDEYSVFRSQYDSQNDNMYIFARKDENKNGMGDNKDPIHIFWISLKDPTKAKRLY